MLNGELNSTLNIQHSTLNISVLTRQPGNPCYPRRTAKMTWWIWVLIGFALLAIEFASTTLHVAFFGLGGLFVALLVGLGWHGPLWAQLLVFTTFSLVALLLIRPPLMRKLKMNESKDVDTLIGENAIAMDDIAVHGFGKAEMR